MSGWWRWVVTGSRSDGRSIASGLQWVSPAWLSVVAAGGLSVLGIYGINLASWPDAAAPATLSEQTVKQFVFLGVGVLAAAAIIVPHPRWLSIAAWSLSTIAMALLVLLLLPGVPESLVSPINGTRAWIKLPGFNAQPSELAKIAFVLLVATLMKRSDEHRRFVGVCRLCALAAMPMGLIALQPDLGTASLFGPSLLAMLIAGGARLRHLCLLGVLALCLAPVSWTFLHDYQQERIVSQVRQLQGDRSGGQDESFQSFTAQRLIAAGGVSGLDAEQTRALVRFNRLPEAHNDMIPSVLMCRFGIRATLALLMGYALWVGGALLTSAWSKDPFGRLVAVGLSAFIAGQALINIGMNVGVLPIIGITLPFVSYGGSSLLTCWLMTGIVFGIGLRRPTPPIRPSFEYDGGHDSS